MQKLLLLDRNYMPLSVVSWKKAIKLIVKGKAEPVIINNLNSKRTIRHGSGVIKIPSIIRLLATIPWKVHRYRMRFTRKKMLIRDNYSCMYCGLNVKGNSATIDHIIPRSRGGTTNYLNCVTSCKKCNNIKGDRTPDEARMPLRAKPKKPAIVTLYPGFTTNRPPEWNYFIIGVNSYANNI